MKYCKWIFVVLLLSSLTSFVEKDKPTKGLNVGDEAPDFCIRNTINEPPTHDLSDLRGQYVLLSFWASHDATSRINNTCMSHTLRTQDEKNVTMVSVSFDEFQSVFQETIRKDRINTSNCFVETKGEASSLFKKYRLKRGYTNYLLNEKGIIIAKDIDARQLKELIN